MALVEVVLPKTADVTAAADKPRKSLRVILVKREYPECGVTFRNPTKVFGGVDTTIDQSSL
jgi:hypothetical protein